MKTYEKPLVMVNNDLAEGVYAASGGGQISGPTANGTYYLKKQESWSGNTKYNVDITNTSSEKVDAVTIVIGLQGTIDQVGGNISNPIIGGNTLTVTFDNYGHGFEANETVNDVYLWVHGNGNYELV